MLEVSEDRREVLIELTPKGDKILKELALRHREELRRTGPEMVSALRKVIRDIELGETSKESRTRRKGRSVKKA